MHELSIDSVDLWFGQNQVLNNVFINCNIGEIVGLLGRNGSGKSTLLKVIFGNLSPHHQHLKVNGEYQKKGYLTKKIAYLPQNYFIPSYLKVGELVDLYTHTFRNELLAVEHIKANFHSSIGLLSGGERRLVEALLVIYSDASFILLDEPFSQLSPLIAEVVKLHISHFQSKKGFIITDHSYNQILAIADRVILMHNRANYTIKCEDDLRLHQYLAG